MGEGGISLHVPLVTIWWGITPRQLAQSRPRVDRLVFRQPA